MKAMILSAGLGTRFKPWTDEHPKALALVNGKSLLQRNVEYLQQYGIKDVVVNVHHFAEQVIDAIEKNKGWGSNIIISNEKEIIGSCAYRHFSIIFNAHSRLVDILSFRITPVPLLMFC